MTFETCPTCGQRHLVGRDSHRTLEGEWCAPADPMNDEELERVRLQNATSFNISWRDTKWVIATAIALKAERAELRAAWRRMVDAEKRADSTLGEQDLADARSEFSALVERT